jgi:hypothetical protein
MKLSTLIADLNEALARVGDVQVVVGEASGMFRDRIGVNTQQSNLVLGDEDDDSPMAIVQAYVVINK